MNGFIICNKLNERNGKFFSQPIFDCPNEISLFFVLPTYVEIILMRSLHDPIVTKLCQSPWNRLYTTQLSKSILFSSFC